MYTENCDCYTTITYGSEWISYLSEELHAIDHNSQLIKTHVVF